MSILRNENDNKVALIKLLATTCLKRTNTKSSLINTRTLNNNVNSITEAILSTYYKELLALRLVETKDVKGLIKIKANSWLNLIDLDKFTPGMAEFNLLPVDDETINAVVDRLVKELTLYKDIVETNIKPTIETIDNYKNSIKAPTSLTDLFAVNIVRPMSTLGLLKDKSLLEYTSNIKLLSSEELVSVKSLLGTITSLDSLDNDPEILMALKEDLTTLNLDEILDNVEELFTGDILKNLNNVSIKEVNVLIYLACMLSSIQRKQDITSPLYSEINTIMFGIIARLNFISNKLDFYKNNSILLMSFINKDDTTVLNVIGDVYDKYLEFSKSLKPLVGVYLSPMVDSRNRDINGIEMFTNIKLSDVQINKSDYERRADEFNASLLLTRQNTDVSKLKTYFIFGLLDTNDFLKEETKDAIKQHILKLNISELGTTEATVLNIFKKYTYKNTNLNIFLNAIEEGAFMLGKKADTKMLAGYASLKLVTLYLASQTELV